MLSFFVRTVKQDERFKMNTLKYLFSAGEAIPSDLVNELMNLSSQISYVNLYGPTEATIYATSYNLKRLKILLTYRLANRLVIFVCTSWTGIINYVR